MFRSPTNGRSTLDNTALVNEVASLFRLNGHSVEISVRINHREIDIVARELQGLIPKVYLIECADYTTPVGVGKIQGDLEKLRAAREDLKEGAVLAHVSRLGYTPDAAGYALSNGLTALTLANLQSNLVNFQPYLDSLDQDRLREIILREYQPTTIGAEGSKSRVKTPALTFIDEWIKSDSNYLILLGDYGVGKSWLLRRYLYMLAERYRADRANAPLPFFVPLQRFTKAFDFQNLVLKTFEQYNLSGVHYSAFLHLVKTGRVVMLLDSFDEMAQHLSRTTIRENLSELFNTASAQAKFIMTSRPNYFENRAERILLVERFEASSSHPLDRVVIEGQTELSAVVEKQIGGALFGRVNDLTSEQRTKLFGIVLEGKPAALETLTGLLKRFQALNHLSQRAVIARLLTTVAETLASAEPGITVDGEPLVPTDVEDINQAKVFEIVLHNLLQRDQGIGALSARDRLDFLKRFAVFLQRRGSDFFATPNEVRDVVRETFSQALSRTDAPEQDLENYYRACRRHSGLTTEGQFYDTSGVIDLPVSEHDLDSRIGFSHNSLREYLVSASIVDAVRAGETERWIDLLSIVMNDLVVHFFEETATYKPELMDLLSAKYLEFDDSKVTEFVFGIISRLVELSSAKYLRLFGRPAQFRGVDLSGMNLSGAMLAKGLFQDCLLQDTNLVRANLKDSTFNKSIIERARVDDAKVEGADFSEANVVSIDAFDAFDTKTSAILEGERAQQWLYSRGAIVSNPERMNKLLGQGWYEAVREVTRTLEKHLAGTHQESSLSKGTSAQHRAFAVKFVNYLVSAGVLERVLKSKYGTGWVVKLNPKYILDIREFSASGKISESLAPFFAKMTADI